MTVRTRLDDLRECWMDGKLTALAALERAFNHGCARFAAGFVNPAPAEEKPAPPKVCSKCGHAHMHGAFCGLPCECDRSKAPGATAKPPPVGYYDCQSTCDTWHMDWRKGERRKGREANNWVHSYDVLFKSKAIFQMSEHGSFMVDRRSGKDRRKP